MGMLISPNRDRRVQILDCIGNRTVRYDVYNYGGSKEYVIRDMKGCVHFGLDTWNRIIRKGEITSFYVPNGGSPRAIDPQRSKNKDRSNPDPDAWKYYARKWIEWSENNA